MKKISVIIPNYNYGRFLDQAIDSALRQTYKPHEVIVVDDGSTDESPKVLESYGNRIKIVYQTNKGVGAARNKGADVATGDILAFLDADDFWADHKLERQMEVLESSPEVGLVHCGLQYVDEKGALGEEFLVGESGNVALKLLRFEHVIPGPGGTSLVPRHIFLSVGGFDENKNLHPSEDWEMSYRIACKHNFGFVGEPLLYYRQHGAGGHTKIARMERAMLIAAEKAFTNGGATIRRIRRESYGNLYMILSGSYFHAGNLRASVRCAIKSVVYSPKQIIRLLQTPFRIQKKLSRHGS